MPDQRLNTPKILIPVHSLHSIYWRDISPIYLRSSGGLL
jgi:hypothetical protein